MSLRAFEAAGQTPPEHCKEEGQRKKVRITQRGTRALRQIRFRVVDLLGITCIHLLDDLIDDLDGRSLVVLAGSLLDKLGNLTLIH